MRTLLALMLFVGVAGAQDALPTTDIRIHSYTDTLGRTYRIEVDISQAHATTILTNPSPPTHYMEAIFSVYLLRNGKIVRMVGTPWVGTYSGLVCYEDEPDDVIQYAWYLDEKKPKENER